VGDTIQFQTQILNADGGLLQAIAPVRVQTAKVMDGVESVRQLVLGGVAILLDERLYGMQVQAVPPPKYDAYQEYIQGREHHTESNWDESFGHFMKAYALDTCFLGSLLNACAASSNAGRFAVADSLARYLEARRSRLSTIQQLSLDGFIGSLSGDLSKTLNAARQAAKLAPGSTYAYQWGFHASISNRPEECIEALKTMDPRKGWARGWLQYWYQLTISYHFLGEHEQELAEAKEAQRLYPESPSPLTYQIRALAAMGKVREIRGVLEESAALPVNAGLAPPLQFYRAGMELRAHGHEDSAMTFLNQAVDACKSTPLADSAGQALLAECLWGARRWKESQAIYEELARKSPDNIDYQGYLGVLAARQGDKESARVHSEWLKNLHTPYLFGVDAYWRARIAAALGDSVQAVELLREAIKKGNIYGWEDHIGFDFEAMKNYPPYVELMKMKR
jgi:tetratricopeptide (TPR) repeat protein